MSNAGPWWLLGLTVVALAGCASDNATFWLSQSAAVFAHLGNLPPDGRGRTTARVGTPSTHDHHHDQQRALLMKHFGIIVAVALVAVGCATPQPPGPLVAGPDQRPAEFAPKRVSSTSPLRPTAA